MERKTFISVILPLKLEWEPCYRLPSDADVVRIGDRVKVRFSNKDYSAVISAVDLIKGIGLCAGMESIDVEGATGNVHTNYDGKAKAAIEAFESGVEFVYVHVEGPDECGHRGEAQNKVLSIELIDEKIRITVHLLCTQSFHL